MRRAILVILACLIGGAALAQSNPGLYQGQVPTAAQWNGFFAQKQDYISNAPISGQVTFKTTVDFNTAGDTPIPITLPSTYTRYIVASVQISGATGDLTTATAGLFTASGGGGVAVVTAASAVTVSTGSDATVNNSQLMTINNASTESYTVAGQHILYFRIATPQGVAASANVTVRVNPLP